MAFKKYTDYFHDGDVYDIYQKDHHVIFWMESAQIPPEDMVDGFELTNFSTLRGQLHLERVKSIYENNKPINEIKKQYDRGDIYDFEIKDNATSMLITWKNRLVKNRKQTDMIEYKFYSEQIYWENLPWVNGPTEKPIQDYQKYFLNGKIIQIDCIENKIIFVIESTGLSKSSDIPFALSRENTLIGELILTWPTNIRVNGLVCSTIAPIIGVGKIKNFIIGHHFIQLDIQWLNIAAGPTGTSSAMSIKIEFGAIDMRNLPNDRGQT